MNHHENRTMETMIINISDLNLPAVFLPKLKTKKVQLIETEEGIVIKPYFQVIDEMMGCLKNSKVSLENFMQTKKENKELDR